MSEITTSASRTLAQCYALLSPAHVPLSQGGQEGSTWRAASSQLAHHKAAGMGCALEGNLFLSSEVYVTKGLRHRLKRDQGLVSLYRPSHRQASGIQTDVH